MKVIFPARSLSQNALCFTTTRSLGKSKPPYDSFNLATHVGDNLDNVEHNRKALYHFTSSCLSNAVASEVLIHQNSVAHFTPLLPFHFLKQIHSSSVIEYSKFEHCDEPTQIPADAIFSNRLKTPLAVLTADCLPIVLVSNSTDEYAAIHAGWKGMKAGIIENTIATFDASKNTISAWIGPAICQLHFEVGAEVAEQFAGYAQYIKRNIDTGKWHIDLPAIASQIIRDMGISDVQQSKICSYCCDDLYSFRQATHSKQLECGRMATVIVKY